jgi:hypothetical protein
MPRSLRVDEELARPVLAALEEVLAELPTAAGLLLLLYMGEQVREQAERLRARLEEELR